MIDNQTMNVNPALDLKSMLIAIGYLILIAGAAYFATRYVGNRSRTRNKSSQLRIMQHLAISRDKSVMLISAGCRYFVIGVAGAQITLLSELSEDELLSFDTEENTGGDNFKTIFGKLMSYGGTENRDGFGKPRKTGKLKSNLRDEIDSARRGKGGEDS